MQRSVAIMKPIECYVNNRFLFKSIETLHNVSCANQYVFFLTVQASTSVFTPASLCFWQSRPESPIAPFYLIFRRGINSRIFPPPFSG